MSPQWPTFATPTPFTRAAVAINDDDRATLMLHFATILASGAPAPLKNLMHDKRELVVGGAPTQRAVAGHG